MGSTAYQLRHLNFPNYTVLDMVVGFIFILMKTFQQVEANIPGQFCILRWRKVIKHPSKQIASSFPVWGNHHCIGTSIKSICYLPKFTIFVNWGRNTALRFWWYARNRKLPHMRETTVNFRRNIWYANWQTCQSIYKTKALPCWLMRCRLFGAFGPSHGPK